MQVIDIVKPAPKNDIEKVLRFLNAAEGYLRSTIGRKIEVKYER